MLDQLVSDCNGIVRDSNAAKMLKLLIEITDLGVFLCLRRIET